MLEDNAQTPPGRARRCNQALGALQRQLQRLLDQHMLAGSEASLRHIEMAARRRQNQHGIDRRIVDGSLDVRGRAEGELLPVSADALGGAAGGPVDLDLVGEIQKAFGMGLRCGSEADDGQTDLFHDLDGSLAAGLRSPCSVTAQA
jgi:hypothetical protein